MKGPLKKELTWEEFLTRWEGAVSLSEATGLLHAAARCVIPCQSSLAYLLKVQECVKFHLDLVSQTWSSDLSNLASQLLVKDWLLRVPAAASSDEAIETHRLLLTFLGECRSALRHPPYPRFVQQYLRNAVSLWINGTHSERWDNGKTYRAYQKLGTEIVDALLAWGLISAVYNSAEKEKKGLIHDRTAEFLAHDVYAMSAAVRAAIASSKPFEEIGRGEEAQIKHRAALVLLYDLLHAREGKVAWEDILDTVRAGKNPILLQDEEVS